MDWTDRPAAVCCIIEMVDDMCPELECEDSTASNYQMEDIGGIIHKDAAVRNQGERGLDIYYEIIVLMDDCCL